MTRTQEEFTAISGPLGDYLRSCPILDEADVLELLRALNPLNKERNIETPQLRALAVLAQEIHTDGCFLGDVARTRIDEMTPHDEDILLAVSETSLALGGDHVSAEDCGECSVCGLAMRTLNLVSGECADCREE